MTMDTVKIFRSYRDAAKSLAASSKEAAYDYLMSILDYGLDDVEPELDGPADAMFLLTKPNIDASKRKAENGAKGGSKVKASGTGEEAKISKLEANDKQAEVSRKQIESKSEAEEGSRKKEVGKRKKDIGRKDDGENIPPKSPQGDAFGVLAGDDKALFDALTAFAAMRKQIKAPMTDRAKSMMAKRLTELSGGNHAAMIAILDQSTVHCWKDVYELKGQQGASAKLSGLPDGKFTSGDAERASVSALARYREQLREG